MTSPFHQFGRLLKFGLKLNLLAAGYRINVSGPDIHFAQQGQASPLLCGIEIIAEGW
jgi:hypothetical protein